MVEVLEHLGRDDAVDRLILERAQKVICVEVHAQQLRIGELLEERTLRAELEEVDADASRGNHHGAPIIPWKSGPSRTASRARQLDQAFRQIGRASCRERV